MTHNISYIRALNATCLIVKKKKSKNKKIGLKLRYWCHYLSTLFTSTLDCCGSSLQQRGPLPHSTFHFQEDLCGVSISVLPSPIKSTCETIRLRGGGGEIRALRFLPWSHWLTLSSLHAVIGSMLGVLLQSLLQFPAALADFYLSGLLEEGKTDAHLESSDDELFFLPQVQVRVALLSANGAELPASVGSRDPSLTPTPTTLPPSPEGVLVVLYFLHSSMRNKVKVGARLQEQSAKAEGVRPGNTCTW